MPRGSKAEHPYSDPPRLPDGDEVAVSALFSGSGPLEIEIGPGRGAFLLERCAVARDARLLGIEIRRKWASVVDARLARDGHGHRARVVCEDAREALRRLAPDGCATRVFVHFPDPWWKKRHQKRLVVIDPLIQQIGRLLCDDGELFVQTDVPNRADDYQQRLDAHTFLVPWGDQPDSPRLAANPYGARSNRERRADEDGLPVHRLRYKRAPRITSSGC